MGLLDEGWLKYANHGAVRNQPISDKLSSALSFLPELGVSMEVFSGGQHGKGSGMPRVGSTRHDHGHAADVFFYKDGKKLDWSDPADLPIFQEIVRRGKSAGITGFGAGPNYMQAGSMHIGFGAPALWGAGGKGANAPDWLREAYSGGQAVSSPNIASSPTISSRSRPQEQPMQTGGLMGMIAPQEQAKADGLLGMIFPNMSADRADKIRIGLLGSTTRPNQALIASIAGGMQQRGQLAAEQRQNSQREADALAKAQEEAQRRNATADWLESQGYTQEAEAVRRGVISGQEGFKVGREAAKGPEYRQITGDSAAAMGLDPAKVYNIGADGKITSIGGANTSITIDNGTYGTPPKDHVWKRNQDGSIAIDERGAPVPLPIGPALIDEENATRESDARNLTKGRVGGTALDEIGMLMDALGWDAKKEQWGESKIAGPKTRSVLGQGEERNSVVNSLMAGGETVDFMNTLQSLQDTIAIERLLEIKAAGSGLGQVPQSQLRALARAMGNLDPSSSDDALRRSLERIRIQYKAVVEASLADANDPTFRGLVEQIAPGEFGGDDADNDGSISNEDLLKKYGGQ